MTHLVSVLILALGITTIARADAPTPPPMRYHVVELASPAVAKPQAQEVKVLLDTPHVKLAMITLRDGKVLEPHSAPMPVTIQALRGRGVVAIGDAREVLGPERMVVLAPGVTHSVVPEGTSELVLLVHHMKAGPGPVPGPGRGK